ncbi:interleukin-10 [Protopterus annectens]|uniref:interleukin-10 n=1 Tax=Protopterus annectens TaxID=7888 RepID=UPI001CFC13F1|nr:interleukin-10 [Protopterus annectens]
MQTVAVVLCSVFLILHVICMHAKASECMSIDNLFPLRLRELRKHFDDIKDHFQGNDHDHDILLLDEELLTGLKGHNGCNLMTDVINFYLMDILPHVNNEDKTINKKISFIENILHGIKETMHRCHNFFFCDKKSKVMMQIKDTFKKLQEKGIIKAVGELDIFFDYIEEYVNSRKKI